MALRMPVAAALRTHVAKERHYRNCNTAGRIHWRISETHKAMDEPKRHMLCRAENGRDRKAKSSGRLGHQRNKKKAQDFRIILTLDKLYCLGDISVLARKINEVASYGKKLEIGVFGKVGGVGWGVWVRGSCFVGGGDVDVVHLAKRSHSAYYFLYLLS
ncbi:hypothetical protein MPH_06185 [Macrophomina phaseolina MS6]|uniref:Uncharacterized protein n=1 Tax=Macrophomina phaseolina (strain MS6) TaxID=1126212 RepID=K2S289_MACPH|nr:hypothetical protein MPH_06185 [Macrophomina phaseolina MS6]